MYPLFSIVSADAGVRSKLGTDPVRVFPFGEAPDDVDLPYAVHQVVSGDPENYISNTPDLDTFVVQVDVYGTTPKEVREAAVVLRDAIEPHAHITGWRGGSKERESGNYRFSFDVDFLTAR